MKLEVMVKGVKKSSELRGVKNSKLKMRNSDKRKKERHHELRFIGEEREDL